MDRKKIGKICNIISLGLVACFFVKTVADYRTYVSTLNSAPFSVWVLVNAVYFLIPSGIVCLLGIMIGKKNCKKK